MCRRVFSNHFSQVEMHHVIGDWCNNDRYLPRQNEEKKLILANIKWMHIDYKMDIISFSILAFVPRCRHSFIIDALIWYFIHSKNQYIWHLALIITSLWNRRWKKWIIIIFMYWTSSIMRNIRVKSVAQMSDLMSDYLYDYVPSSVCNANNPECHYSRDNGVGNGSAMWHHQSPKSVPRSVPAFFSASSSSNSDREWECIRALRRPIQCFSIIGHCLQSA